MRMNGWLALAMAPVVAPVVALAATVGQMTPAEPLTPARIASQAGKEQAAWLAYLERSQALMAADKAALAAERAGLAAIPASQGEGKGNAMALGKDAAWYAGAEALRVADNIVSYQTPAGGWGKNVDRAGPPRQRGEHYVHDDSPGKPGAWSYVGTTDNGATIAELRFLARVVTLAPEGRTKAYRDAFTKGARYLLASQYPNGGFPQVYPLMGGYHDAITYNDNAYANVVELLRAIGERQGDFAFVPEPLAAEVRAAAARAVDVILASQVVARGVRTGWCQQHDMLTLAPVGARNFEPVALSSGESAQLLRVLMRTPQPSPQVAAAVHAGVEWLRGAGLRDIAWKKTEQGKMQVPEPGAGPIWARYYDIATNKPVFGDRDRSIHDDVNELSLERRNGYAWFTNGLGSVFGQYESWAKKNPRVAQ